MAEKVRDPFQTPSLKTDVWKYFGFWSWRGKGSGQEPH